MLKLPIDFTSNIITIDMIKKHKIRTKLINLSWFRFFESFILKKISFIRILNKKMYKDLLELNFPKKNILNISNGISIESFSNFKKNEHNGTYYGFVGRLVEFKNLRFLLDVFKKYLLKYPNDKLLIYGEGSEKEFILQFINSNHLYKNIIYCGFEKDIRKIYSNLDVLIDPALGQGISNTNLEAMCSNTFLIASDVYGNQDLIRHGDTGLLFNPIKKSDLIKQMEFYKNNNNEVKRIIKNAKKELALNYDIKIIAEKIYNFLQLRLGSRKKL